MDEWMNTPENRGMSLLEKKGLKECLNKHVDCVIYRPFPERSYSILRGIQNQERKNARCLFDVYPERWQVFVNLRYVDWEFQPHSRTIEIFQKYGLCLWWVNFKKDRTREDGGLHYKDRQQDPRFGKMHVSTLLEKSSHINYINEISKHLHAGNLGLIEDTDILSSNTDVRLLRPEHRWVEPETL